MANRKLQAHTHGAHPALMQPASFVVDQRPALLAARTVFLLLGIVFSTWAARIPAIRDSLALTPAELGVVLLCAGVGAMIAFPFAAPLVARRGGQRAAWYSGAALVVMLGSLPWAGSMPVLMALMVGLGTAQTCFNVSINAIGSELETAHGRSLLSMLHAWYCVGALAGGLLGSVLAGANVEARQHLTSVALLLLLTLWLSCRNLPEGRAQGPIQNKLRVPHGALVPIGLICCCASIAEGAVLDWSSVYMRDELNASEGLAPIALSAFSGLMLVVRLRADRLKDRFGAQHVVALGALVAAAGMSVVVAAPGPVVTILGFAIAGAGMAPVFPFVMSAAAAQGSGALASVATMAYAGLLLGPPVIGFVANDLGMPVAMSIVGWISLTMAVLAFRSRGLA